MWCAAAMVCFLPSLAPAWQQANPSPAVHQSPPPTLQEPAQPTSVPPFGPISSYLGIPVAEIRFKAVAEREKDHRRELIPQKVGKPLDRELVRESVKLLFDTGLFADLQVEAEKNSNDQVILTLSTISNYFVGSINVEGDPGRPSANQIVSSTKFQLGEVYTPDRMERAQKNILQLMSDNGFYHASVTYEEHAHPETDQMDILFR